MNKLDFNQVGGFPMTTNILNELQKGHEIFNALGNIAGNLTIISGCQLIGTTISDGVVFIDGEVMAFQGGNVQTKVIVKDDVQQLVFQDDNSKDVIHIRYATFGTGAVFKLWADFKRLFPTKDIQEALDSKAPTTALESLLERLDELEKKTAIFQTGGGMVLWNKPANLIPEGWQEVEDWRGRIPAGFDPDDVDYHPVGKEGGAKTQTLAIENLPPHDHDIAGSSSDNGDPGNMAVTAFSQPNAGMTTSETGSGTAFGILNPYRVVIFIEYVA